MLENASVCESSGTQVQEQPVVVEKQENVLTGVVGALIGAALGGASIILLSQIGYVAAISGLILAVCTLKGYELLGGKLSNRGIFICCMLMAVTPYVADRMSWAIAIVQEFADYNVTFGEAFSVVHDLIKESDLMGEYVKGLAMVYLFTAMGAFGTLKGLFNKKN